MKIKSESIIQAALLACALCIGTVIAGSISGCVTNAQGEKKFLPLVFLSGNTNDIENKAYRGTRLIVYDVLKEGRTNAIPKLQIASEDLLELENSPQITPEKVLNIINNLPKGTIKNPDRLFYITEGVLMITDEGGTIGAMNPQQLQAVARGGRRAIDSMLQHPGQLLN